MWIWLLWPTELYTNGQFIFAGAAIFFCGSHTAYCQKSAGERGCETPSQFRRLQVYLFLLGKELQYHPKILTKGLLLHIFIVINPTGIPRNFSSADWERPGHVPMRVLKLSSNACLKFLH